MSTKGVGPKGPNATEGKAKADQTLLNQLADLTNKNKILKKETENLKNKVLELTRKQNSNEFAITANDNKLSEKANEITEKENALSNGALVPKKAAPKKGPSTQDAAKAAGFKGKGFTGTEEGGVMAANLMQDIRNRLGGRAQQFSQYDDDEDEDEVTVRPPSQAKKLKSSAATTPVSADIPLKAADAAKPKDPLRAPILPEEPVKPKVDPRTLSIDEQIKLMDQQNTEAISQIKENLQLVAERQGTINAQESLISAQQSSIAVLDKQLKLVDERYNVFKLKVEEAAMPPTPSTTSSVGAPPPLDTSAQAPFDAPPLVPPPDAPPLVPPPDAPPLVPPPDAPPLVPPPDAPPSAPPPDAPPLDAPIAPPFDAPSPPDLGSSASSKSAKTKRWATVEGAPVPKSTESKGEADASKAKGSNLVMAEMAAKQKEYQLKQKENQLKEIVKILKSTLAVDADHRKHILDEIQKSSTSMKTKIPKDWDNQSDVESFFASLASDDKAIILEAENSWNSAESKKRADAQAQAEAAKAQRKEDERLAAIAKEQEILKNVVGDDLYGKLKNIQPIQDDAQIAKITEFREKQKQIQTGLKQEAALDALLSAAVTAIPTMPKSQPIASAPATPAETASETPAKIAAGGQEGPTKAVGTPEVAKTATAVVADADKAKPTEPLTEPVKADASAAPSNKPPADNPVMPATDVTASSTPAAPSTSSTTASSSANTASSTLAATAPPDKPEDKPKDNPVTPATVVTASSTSAAPSTSSTTASSPASTPSSTSAATDQPADKSATANASSIPAAPSTSPTAASSPASTPSSTTTATAPSDKPPADKPADNPVTPATVVTASSIPAASTTSSTTASSTASPASSTSATAATASSTEPAATADSAGDIGLEQNAALMAQMAAMKGSDPEMIAAQTKRLEGLKNVIGDEARPIATPSPSPSESITRTLKPIVTADKPGETQSAAATASSSAAKAGSPEPITDAELNEVEELISETPQPSPTPNSNVSITPNVATNNLSAAARLSALQAPVPNASNIVTNNPSSEAVNFRDPNAHGAQLPGSVAAKASNINEKTVTDSFEIINANVTNKTGLYYKDTSLEHGSTAKDFSLFKDYGEGVRDKISRKFNAADKSLNLTLSRNAQEDTFHLFCEINKGFGDLTMERPCNDPATILKLLEAGMKANMKIKLTPEDEALFAQPANKEFQAYYEFLKEPTLEKQKEYLDKLAREPADSGRKFGEPLHEFRTAPTPAVVQNEEVVVTSKHRNP